MKWKEWLLNPLYSSTITAFSTRIVDILLSNIDELFIFILVAKYPISIKCGCPLSNAFSIVSSMFTLIDIVSANSSKYFINNLLYALFCVFLLSFDLNIVVTVNSNRSISTSFKISKNPITFAFASSKQHKNESKLNLKFSNNSALQYPCCLIRYPILIRKYPAQVLFILLTLDFLSISSTILVNSSGCCWLYWLRVLTFMKD
eukprot:NODE_13_length_42895_cov_0.518413.p18 type:complete len:203 gc:universal NODE_13_length_42895_cov_0.518413:27739-28347(+)